MANTMKALQTVTVGAGGVSSVTFSSIPQTYTDLIVKVSSRDNRSAVYRDLDISFNGVTTNRAGRLLYGDGSTVGSYSVANGFWAFDVGNTALANTFSNIEYYIPNYASSNYKSVSVNSVTENNATLVTTNFTAGLWSNTAAITSITFTPETGPLLQYSTFTLYGVFNADVSAPPAAPTIGTATAGVESASVAFTGVSGAASYTATSTPGSIAATGTVSPINVSGLAPATAYTFKVKANNPFGSGAESAASNSVTPTPAAYTSLATSTVGAGGASSVTFSSIPSDYTHLQIRYIAKGNNAGDLEYLGFRFNGYTGDYWWHQIFGDGATATGTNFQQSFMRTFIQGNDGATTFGAGVADILDYANTNKNKTLRMLGGTDNNGTGFASFSSGLWTDTSAITSVTILGVNNTLKAGSSFALYGIKAV